MANNPPSPWVFDYTNEQFVRWHNQRRCWVDEREREARPPQASPPTVAPPPGQRGGGTAPGSKSSGKPAMISGNTTSTSAGPSAGSSASTTTSIENSLKQLNLASSTTKPAVLPAYRTTATDDRTGAETLWDITETRQYRDPRTSDSVRSLNVKRVRQPDAKKGARSIIGFQASADPLRDYRPGRVIEVALVPPNPNMSSSALSQITPSPGTSSHTPQRIRYRRFVIVRQRPEGRNSFEALAIKTYNGLGVSATGVIKSHHAIIHTGAPPPSPLQEELPKKRPNGQLEGAMQAMPIKVEQFDKAKALDPRARLDYMDWYEFDYGVTNIRLWGRIHPDSEAAFYSQYSHVWAEAMGAAVGPGQVTNYGGPAQSDTASTTGTVTAAQYSRSYQTPATATGAALGTGNPRVAPPVRTERRVLTEVPTAPQAPSSGVITDQAMWTIVRRYQEYAKEKDLTVPGQTLTQQQVHSLAINAQSRATFLQRIKDAWEAEMDDSD